MKKLTELLEERLVRPHAAAALLAGFYVALAVVYIVTSSHVAAVTAQSVQHLERLERAKGIGRASCRERVCLVV